MKKNGFTLSEILVSLLIVAQIVVFTIPKVITSQQNSTYNAIAKEAASTIAGAYNLYRIQNTPTSSTTFGAFTQYLNHVSVQTSGSVDNKQTSGSIACSATTPCMKLHNGAIIRYNSGDFGGTATTNALEFLVDPNGTDSGTTNGPDKSVNFFMYFNGRLVTRGTIEPNTYANTATWASPAPTLDPPWFSW